MADITGNFDWQTQAVVPAFVQGKDAITIYNAIKELGLGWMDYDSKTSTLRGSTTLMAAKIDTLLRPYGIRVAGPKDFMRPEVAKMVEGKHYSDTPRLILSTTDDSNSRNLSLIKRIAELVEGKNGRLELPVLVRGFDVKPCPGDERGYKLEIVARDDFTATHDERLSGAYSGKRISGFDENEIPVFDKNGSRTWYARGKGLSRLCLGWDLSIYSLNGSLALSYSVGRVVLINAVGTQKK